jgi:peptide chain release factor 2
MEINSGAGGTESNDWAGMLLRMYTRWANAHGMTTDFLEETDGEQAGIKSVTLQIKGHNAYGWLKTEAGVHRLVRISPTTAPPSATPASPRCGSIRWWTTRYRDRHQPVGRADRHLSRLRRRRSAHQQDRLGRAPDAHSHGDRRGLPGRSLAAPEPRRSLEDAARPPLRGELQRREAEQQALEDQKTDIGWGHQIRSYVLQPYQMVKDLRTNVETSDTDGVLDGDLDAFMGASLAQRVGATRTLSLRP